MAVGAPSRQCGLRCNDPQSRSSQMADQMLRVMERDSSQYPYSDLHRQSQWRCSDPWIQIVPLHVLLTAWMEAVSRAFVSKEGKRYDGKEMRLPCVLHEV